MTQGTNYNASYYKKNKDKLLAQKRKRYRTDPSYRDSLRKSRQRAYAKKKKEQAKLGDYVIRVVDGKPVKVLKVGVVIAKLGITNPILSNWEKTGVVPKADTRFGKARCYTDSQFECLKFVANLRKNAAWSIKELREQSADFINENWNKEN